MDEMQNKAEAAAGSFGCSWGLAELGNKQDKQDQRDKQDQQDQQDQHARSAR